MFKLKLHCEEIKSTPRANPVILNAHDNNSCKNEWKWSNLIMKSTNYSIVIIQK